MNNTAINPAAACPDWCTATHEGDWLVTRPDGQWNALHEGREEFVETGETVTPGLTDYVVVRAESFACDSPGSWYPRSIRLDAINTYGSKDAFVLTARQALRLAEVLVQQAAAVLAEESATLEVTR